ncbi:helix-turn-helix transcriptional regulator [Actinomadura kijaniata]|uniref:Transcriptional regulator with XRE-family HTH domain n=1 Tax=Actinomadura namibiensis TaxID=182080 RepID=A0A7W3LL21_ACTNM|nr:helix-turn-helix transcriptional regulator [Actinomadura namibiensis]MBA8950118.1 transcriptional regulator with XRE-family HTH domain [Actinomadura namibiensis]
MTDLGGFLRARRGRVAPRSVGLPDGPRRRVPGLRREEVAQLAGISVEYYQRLEQGRASRPSPEVLDALARALDLSEVERAHLHALARPPRTRTGGEERARPELRRMLAMMDRLPALVTTDRYDVLAANAMAVRLFGPVLTLPDVNLARFLFLDPAARAFYAEWDEVAAATAGEFRETLGRFPGDGALAELVAELAEGSAAFRALWGAGDVVRRSSGAKGFRHPAVGVLRLRYEHFVPVDAPRQRLITLVPAEGDASEAALQLLASWSGAAPAERVAPDQDDHAVRR